MIFLDLGSQPLANEYLKKKDINKKEKKYRLLIDFNNKNKVVSIKKKFSSEIMFKNNYPYRSSMSKTMKSSFKDFANEVKKKYKPKNLLEIGCNDGTFLKNFNKKISLGIEPCANIANISKKKNLNVISKYWSRNLAKNILKNYGKFNLIYSANTITHIKNLDEVFKAINILLSKNGLLIIEDPSLLECIKNNTYDQFYNEHLYVFSYISLSNILKKYDLKIFKIKNIKQHGGSTRYFIKKSSNVKKIHLSVSIQKSKEKKFGLHKIKTYKKFAYRVKKSKNKLKKIFQKIYKDKKKIIGYGATAKAVTILNYCNINKKYIDFFVDTTPEKQGKFIPGVKIPIKKYSKINKKIAEYVFLGAWNFKKEIFLKEKKFLSSGGKFIMHFPYPKIVN